MASISKSTTFLPRALGGGDEPSNTVELTYREHFLAHWLLTKTLEGRAKQAMVFALHAMTFDYVGNRIRSAWRYEVAKRALKRLVAVRAKARYEAKRERSRLEREAAAVTAGHVVLKAVGLKMGKRADRKTVEALTDDLLKGRPVPLSSRQRHRHGVANAKDRQRIIEAHTILGLPHPPDDTKRKRIRHSKRMRDALKAVIEQS